VLTTAVSNATAGSTRLEVFIPFYGLATIVQASANMYAILLETHWYFPVALHQQGTCSRQDQSVRVQRILTIARAYSILLHSKHLEMVRINRLEAAARGRYCNRNSAALLTCSVLSRQYLHRGHILYNR
jgi:hypothetical protein